ETLCLGHGFHSGVPLNSPTRRGSEARQVVEDSAATSKAIDEAVRARVKANPQATNFEIAQGVTMDLLSTIPTMLDPDLKLPGSAATLWAHLRDARESA